MPAQAANLAAACDAWFGAADGREGPGGHMTSRPSLGGASDEPGKAIGTAAAAVAALLVTLSPPRGRRAAQADSRGRRLAG
jgi:hypothetical protein